MFLIFRGPSHLRPRPDSSIGSLVVILLNKPIANRFGACQFERRRLVIHRSHICKSQAWSRHISLLKVVIAVACVSLHGHEGEGETRERGERERGETDK